MSNPKFILRFFITQLISLLIISTLFMLIPDRNSRVALAGSIQHYSLLAETMHPIDSSIEYNNYSAFLTTTKNSSVNLSTDYIGQLDLPHGTRIAAARCFGKDSDPSGEFFISLYRYNLWHDPVYSQVSSIDGSGYLFDAGKIMVETTIDADMNVVDNDQFSYGIYLDLPKASSGELGLLRCVVDTTYNIALPVIQRH